MRNGIGLITTGALLMFGQGAGIAADLSAVLECRDAAALGVDAPAFASYGRDAGFDCRLHERQRESTVYCTGAGRATAFGASVKEFNRARAADGRTTLSVAFTEPPSRLEPRVRRAREEASSSMLATAVVDEREDGVAELRCSVGGSSHTTGAIAGTLDFRGVEPLPAMRVCAAPVRAPQSPQCVQTVTGQRDYRIEGLPAGDYYVTAFALENNPNRLFGVYTSPLSNCPEGATDCAGERLQRIPVFPGEVRDGVDPATLMRELPSPLRSTARTSGG